MNHRDALDVIIILSGTLFVFGIAAALAAHGLSEGLADRAFWIRLIAVLAAMLIGLTMFLLWDVTPPALVFLVCVITGASLVAVWRNL
jgi:hypothetical protein